MGNSQTADKIDPHLSPEQPANAQQSKTNDQQPNAPSSASFTDDRDSGPGTFEDLHKKCKGIVMETYAGNVCIVLYCVPANMSN